MLPCLLPITSLKKLGVYKERIRRGGGEIFFQGYILQELKTSDVLPLVFWELFVFKSTGDLNSLAACKETHNSWWLQRKAEKWEGAKKYDGRKKCVVLLISFPFQRQQGFVGATIIPCTQGGFCVLQRSLLEVGKKLFGLPLMMR